MNEYNNNFEKHGPWEIYHSNGQLASKRNYVNGKLHGSYESYNTNGRVSWKGIFKDGRRIGFWLDGFSDGKILKYFYL